MKHLTPFIIYFLGIICLTSIQCKKNKTEPDNSFGLPDATQIGAMTFACLINGDLYSAKKNSIEIGGGVSKDSVFAFGGASTTSGIYFNYLRFVQKKGTVLNTAIKLDDENNYFEVSGDHDCRGLLIPAYQYRGKGEVFFTRLDTVNKIMSGKFHCIIPVPGCDTLKITEGRFDLRYYN